MNIVRRITGLIVISVGVFLALSSIGFGQQRANDPLKSPISITVTRWPAERLFSSLSKQIPIGFELIKFEESESLITLSLEKVELKVVLDNIIEQMPNYSWSLEDGIIIVRPRALRSALLEFRISELKFENAAYRDLGPKILGSSVIANEVEKEGLVFGWPALDEPGSMSSRIEERNGRKTSFTGIFSNGTLREMLNKMLRDGNAQYWLFKIENTNKRNVSLVIENH